VDVSGLDCRDDQDAQAKAKIIAKQVGDEGAGPGGHRRRAVNLEKIPSNLRNRNPDIPFFQKCARGARFTGDLSGPGPRAFLSANSLFEVPRLIEP
jgi:hypothetical protein